MSSRRQFAATVAALLSTGCLGNGPSGESPSRTDDAPSPGDDSHSSGDDCTSGVLLEMASFEPTEQLPWPLDDADQAFVERAVSSGSLTVETYAPRPPVEGGVFVVVDGTYRETTVEELGREQVPAWTFDVTWENGREPPGDASVLEYADLPAVDQEALDHVVEGMSNEREEFPKESFEANDAPVPYPDGTDGSTLVERERAWVEWEDRFFEIEVGEETSKTVHTFEFGTMLVAESDAAFREYVAERYVVALDSLSADERRVVEAAIEDEYEECEPTSDGYDDLRERISAGEELPDPGGNQWYVERDGTRYEATFRSWEH